MSENRDILQCWLNDTNQPEVDDVIHRTEDLIEQLSDRQDGYSLLIEIVRNIKFHDTKDVEYVRKP